MQSLTATEARLLALRSGDDTALPEVAGSAISTTQVALTTL